MVNQILNISLVTNILKKIRHLCIFHPQIIIYKRNFDERRNAFIKYMKILEKVRNIIENKFNSKLMYMFYSKTYLKAVKKKKNTKGGFQCLYAPVILIDSIYGKVENYYTKVFLEKYYFIENIEIYCINFDEEYYNEECINLFLETL